MLRLTVLAFAAHGCIAGTANATPHQAADGRYDGTGDRGFGAPAGGFRSVANNSNDLQPVHGFVKHKSGNAGLYNSTPKGGRSSPSAATPKIAHASSKAAIQVLSAAHHPVASAKATQAWAPQAVAPAPSLVERVQMALAKAGDYSGKVDGVLGPETVKALSLYQQAQGLAQTGRADGETLDKLGVSIP